MIPLATPTELATYLQTATQAEADGGNPNVLDTAVATQAIESASGKIRSAAGWSITEETFTRTFTSYTGRFFLPSLHLTAVSMTVAGAAVAAERFTFDQDTGEVSLAPYWSWPLGPLAVTYTSGYPEVPDPIRGLCLEIAAGLYSNPSQAVSITYGNVTETYLRQGAPGIEDLRQDQRLSPYVYMGFA